LRDTIPYFCAKSQPSTRGFCFVADQARQKQRQASSERGNPRESARGRALRLQSNAEMKDWDVRVLSREEEGV
jgi:hypothetical protein